MLIKKPADIRPSEITSKDNYLDRRRFMQAAAAAGGAIIGGEAFPAMLPEGPGAKLDGVVPSKFSTDEKTNSYVDVTSYNNFYEFGMRKEDPFRNAQEFKPRPWSVEVSGNAEVTGTFDLEDFLQAHTLEERIYRLRCVEAWSMVIPLGRHPARRRHPAVQAPVEREVR